MMDEMNQRCEQSNSVPGSVPPGASVTRRNHSDRHVALLRIVVSETFEPDIDHTILLIELDHNDS